MTYGLPLTEDFIPENGTTLGKKASNQPRYVEVDGVESWSSPAPK